MDQVGSTSIIYNPSMTDERFIEAISDFLQATNRTKRTNFEIGGVSFSLHKLFQIVSLSMGGFRKVTEGNRWVSVATSMGFPGTLENCKQFAMIYGTVLFPFEQHVISKIPLAKLSATITQNASLPQAPVPKNIPTPAPVPSMHELLSTVARHKDKSWPLEGDLPSLIKSLSSESFELRVFALASLERLFYDSNTSTLSNDSIQALLDALCFVNHHIAMNQELTDVSHTLQPGDLKSSLVNVLRSLSLRKEAAFLMSKHNGLLSLITCELTAETCSVPWMILSSLSHSMSLSCPFIKDVFSSAEKVLSSSTGILQKFSFTLTSSLAIDTSNVEAVKRAIISFIQTSNIFWKRTPPECHMVLETICRLVVNSSEDDVDSTVMVALMEAIWSFLQCFSLILVKLCQLLFLLLSNESFQKSADYPKWLSMVLHNVNFSFPDGGYIELSLLTLINLLKKTDCPNESIQPLACRTISSLVSWISCLRKLWLCPPSNLFEKSPLLCQPATASNSQPYLVLKRMFQLLNLITATCDVTCSQDSIMSILEWIMPPTHHANELLWNEPIQRTTEMLLARMDLAM